ncbi:amidase [uncultured Enterovirga sp.]|uniref:amidase n=1 Tax=uncultured Enterovirga sp. TaxID=2026352 RepID=UPI0035C9B391
MLSLVDITGRIRSGRLTPDAALALSADAIRDREAEVGAFVRLAPEPTRAGQGRLAGIAVAVKDIIDTADMPTEMGAPAIHGGWQPRADAPVVAALRRAGATIIGKSTTTAFATTDPTETRNPHDLGHTPGGSSAGSAAAVGAGMVPLALGTQTGGSVIRPASFCGAAAIKPSFRLLPTVGVKCLAWTLDTVGLFAAGTADLAAALAILSGRSMEGTGLRTPRLGLVRQRFAGAAEPDGERALEEAADILGQAGATIVEPGEPAAIAEGWHVHPAIQDFEAATSLAWEYDNARDRLPPHIRDSLDRGRGIAASEYDEARRVANRARRDAKLLFRDVDAVLTYSATGAAPRGLASTGDPKFNRLWTMLGTPCVTVPGLRNAAALPIGIQVVAPFARDHVALEVAEFVEAALAGTHD